MKRLVIVMAVVMLMVAALPASSLAAPMADTTYTVQPGDNLYRIAIRYNTTVEAIQQANGLSGTVIYIGQVLIIPDGSGSSSGGTTGGDSGSTPAPSGGTYTVVAGDTLYGIARRYSTTVEAIQQANNWTSTIIYTGQVLKIPGAGDSGSAGGSSGDSGSAGGSSGGTTGSTSGTYVVKAGDTLYRIALANGTTVAALQQTNNISGSFIYIGQVLVMPGSQTSGSSGGGTPAPTPAPAPSGNAAAGGFEIGGQVAGFGPNAESAMDSAKMTWVKRQVYWGPGANPNDQQGLIDDAHNRGFKIIIGLTGGPGESSPANFDEFADYAAGLASLGADAIEVWNEPNIDRQWAAGTISPATYTQMLQKAYNAIKAVNPSTIVVSAAPAPTGFYGGGCTGNGCDDVPFIQGIVNAGGVNYMDCLGIHYNEGVLPPTATSGDPRGNSGHYTRYYQRMVDEYYNAVGGRVPLCFTELGYLSGEEWGYLPSGFLWKAPYNLTVAEQAAYYGQAVELSRQQGKVRLLIIFNVDFTHWSEDPQAGYAMIRPNGDCPACSTIAAAMP